ncbi:uncharacterized protein LOC129594647 [Paramacrobiotus metropolitanus]|uniref:uncharacterized protein LOC129594647 n=1 Tax=Paramacrobiotus metropolitanus TaxID=2943436 RepID=UPI002445C17A|nr:uncharacterized protein LOC129594647 [Paramacrobiotus metropolitanus]
MHHIGLTDLTQQIASDMGWLVSYSITVMFAYGLGVANEIRSSLVFGTRVRNWSGGLSALAINSASLAAMTYLHDKIQDMSPVVARTTTLPNIKDDKELIQISMQMQIDLNTKPPGFSVAGAWIVNREFIAGLIGVYATYILLTWDRK